MQRHSTCDQGLTSGNRLEETTQSVRVSGPELLQIPPPLGAVLPLANLASFCNNENQHETKKHVSFTR